MFIILSSFATGKGLRIVFHVLLAQSRVYTGRITELTMKYLVVHLLSDLGKVSKGITLSPLSAGEGINPPPPDTTV